MFPIEKKLIKKNNPNTFIKPVGLVIHETANPNADALMHYKYFNNTYRGSSAHAFIDWNRIVQTINWNKKAWHAGRTANKYFIGIELCHATTADRFNVVYNQAVELFAFLFVEVLGIKTVTNENLMSHDEVSNKWKETDHKDPISYFAKFGKTVDGFRSDVQNQIKKSIIKEVLGMFSDDNKIGTWAKPSVDRLVKLGLLKGDENNKFNPQNFLTREQFAVVADKILQLLGR